MVTRDDAADVTMMPQQLHLSKCPSLAMPTRTMHANYSVNNQLAGLAEVLEVSVNNQLTAVLQ